MVVKVCIQLKGTIQYGYGLYNTDGNSTRTPPNEVTRVESIANHHRPVSRAVASLADFSSACRSAKVSADILKLTSCAEFVGLALNAGGPYAPAPGPRRHP